MARGWKRVETVHREHRVPFGSKSAISSKSSSGRSLMVDMIRYERYNQVEELLTALFVSVEF